MFAGTGRLTAELHEFGKLVELGYELYEDLLVTLEQESGKDNSRIDEKILIYLSTMLDYLGEAQAAIVCE